jgi:predicted RNase H-like nuclease (RuvC/YqgF family)
VTSKVGTDLEHLGITAAIVGFAFLLGKAVSAVVSEYTKRLWFRHISGKRSQLDEFASVLAAVATTRENIEQSRLEFEELSKALQILMQENYELRSKLEKVQSASNNEPSHAEDR